jgi:hypothetical protein
MIIIGVVSAFLLAIVVIVGIVVVANKYGGLGITESQKSVRHVADAGTTILPKLFQILPFL